LRGEHDLRHHLVELHVLHVRQRVVLAVDRPGLQAGVGLGVRHRRRIRAERAAEQLQASPGGMRSLTPARSDGVLIFFFRLQADLARTEEGRPEDLDLHLLLGLLLVLCAEFARPEAGEVVGVAEQIRRGSGSTTPGSAWRCPAERYCHLQVVALQGDQLRALLEQVAL